MARILDINNHRETYRSINHLQEGNNDAPLAGDEPDFMGDPALYPWVRIPYEPMRRDSASLYVSAAMSGNESFVALIKELATKPERERRPFVIVSGRHGRECGNQLAAVGWTRLHASARDAGGAREDRESLQRAARDLHPSMPAGDAVGAMKGVSAA